MEAIKRALHQSNGTRGPSRYSDHVPSIALSCNHARIYNLGSISQHPCKKRGSVQRRTWWVRPEKNLADARARPKKNQGRAWPMQELDQRTGSATSASWSSATHLGAQLKKTTCLRVLSEGMTHLGARSEGRSTWWVCINPKFSAGGRLESRSSLVFCQKASAKDRVGRGRGLDHRSTVKNLHCCPWNSTSSTSFPHSSSLFACSAAWSPKRSLSLNSTNFGNIPHKPNPVLD